MTVVFGPIGTPSILESLVTSFPRMLEFQSCRWPHSSNSAHPMYTIAGFARSAKEQHRLRARHAHVERFSVPADIAAVECPEDDHRALQPFKPCHHGIDRQTTRPEVLYPPQFN